MPVIKFNFFRLLVILFCALLSACASFSPQTQKLEGSVNARHTVISSAAAAESDLGWWQIGFHRNMQEDEDPAWYMDTLVAYKIIKPVLDQYEQKISLWRFHRRAAADASGHQFSFIFYSNRSSGELIYKQVKESELVQILLNENYIDRMSFYDINGIARAEVETTSDNSWPIELQKAWPEFAMGVSKTWLNLVGEYLKQSNESDSQNVTEQVEQFREISNKIDLVWEEKGSHAFLHHLNALFGYQELYIIERKRTRF
ncbi:hypothetical protein [Kaarinaea lacus]